MKRQEIFDKVYTHLLTQGVSSRNEDQCLYRGPERTACAIGCLIPDELYNIMMEGSSVDTLFAEYPKVRKLIGLRNEEFLNELQSCHDTYVVKDWESRLKEIAKDFNVKVPK